MNRPLRSNFENLNITHNHNYSSHKIIESKFTINIAKLMVDHTKQFGESYALQWCTYFQRNSLFSIVCSKPNTTYSMAFLEKHHVHPLFIVHRSLYRFLTRWDLLRLASVTKSVVLIKFKLYGSTY